MLTSHQYFEKNTFENDIVSLQSNLLFNRYHPNHHFPGILILFKNEQSFDVSDKRFDVPFRLAHKLINPEAPQRSLY